MSVEPAGTCPPSRSKGSPAAHLPLVRLYSLWFQVTGLLCNLECTHCLVDSSPKNKSLDFLTVDAIRNGLLEAEANGVKEIYFTGGEPFLHKQMLEILELSLAVAPTTVLTNGTLITERLARSLGALAEAASYSLEIRVSLDHPDPVQNDAVRGAGAHAKALRAVQRLTAAGLAPIVTATEYLLEPRTPTRPGGVYEGFLDMLREAGIDRPRLKVLPVFHTGKLEDPSHGGAVTEAMIDGLDPLQLQCAETRVVAADGIYACPILVGQRTARMSTESLAEAMSPVHLSHHACLTCYETGMSCGNL